LPVIWSTLVSCNVQFRETGIHTLGSSVTNRVDVLLSRLHVGQVPCLVVDIENLLVSLFVERPELLTSGSAHGLFKVRVQAAPSRVGLFGDAVLLVDSLRLLSSLESVVEVGQGSHEAVADSVLAVEGDGSFNGLVADGVAMCKILGDDTRTRLVLLLNVISHGFIGRAARFATSHLIEGGCRRDVDLSRAKLGVIKEEGCLCRSFLFERDSSRLSAIFCAGLWCDRDGLYLSTVFVD